MASKYLFQQEVRHNGLNKYRVVKAETRYELQQKVASLEAQWNEQWIKKCALEQQKREKEQKLKSIEDSIKYAEELTKEAESIQEALDRILLNSINKKGFDINKKKVFLEFTEEKPIQPQEPFISIEPRSTDTIYNPKEPLICKISKKKSEEFKKKNIDAFKRDWEQWNVYRDQKQAEYAEEMCQYNEVVAEWEIRKQAFLKRQNNQNNEIDEVLRKYNEGNQQAIEQYNMLALNDEVLPIDFESEIEVEYNSNNKMLIVDMFLPTMEKLPKLKKVSFVKTKNEFKKTFHTEAYLRKKYDNVIYQIVLATINIIVKNDCKHDYIQNIVLNGRNSTIDKTTGKNIEPYVLSINVTKSDFCELNLSAIDPKAWFKKAKGISAASFAEVAPVAPIVVMNREDARFIEGYDVIEKIDDSINLAAIDWRDFENLIREIFEQEFNSNGGEVKITQASRDGGVDAIAFDPDPIRGGKIVIQAKRYTNVVGVSAVRDLYGTVMNEGAIKGILVTTSNFGSDAYNFADGKPITLMNGANLLHMLERHGHKARIDLKEAKQILNN